HLCPRHSSRRNCAPTRIDHSVAVVARRLGQRCSEPYSQRIQWLWAQRGSSQSAEIWLLWQNGRFRDTIDGKQNDPHTRTACQGTEGSQESSNRRAGKGCERLRTRANLRRVSPLGILGSQSRSAGCVSTA